MNKAAALIELYEMLPEAEKIRVCNHINNQAVTIEENSGQLPEKFKPGNEKLLAMQILRTGSKATCSLGRRR